LSGRNGPFRKRSGTYRRRRGKKENSRYENYFTNKITQRIVTGRKKGGESNCSRHKPYVNDIGGKYPSMKTAVLNNKVPFLEKQAQYKKVRSGIRGQLLDWWKTHSRWAAPLVVGIAREKTTKRGICDSDLNLFLLDSFEAETRPRGEREGGSSSKPRKEKIFAQKRNFRPQQPDGRMGKRPRRRRPFQPLQLGKRTVSQTHSAQKRGDRKIEINHLTLPGEEKRNIRSESGKKGSREIDSRPCFWAVVSV